MNRQRKSRNTLKFMQVLDKRFYRKLRTEAVKKGITVQELIRAIIIPEYLDRQIVKKKTR